MDIDIVDSIHNELHGFNSVEVTDRRIGSTREIVIRVLHMGGQLCASRRVDWLDFHRAKNPGSMVEVICDGIEQEIMASL